MCGMNLHSNEETTRKKNKLGYHRQSVACSFCRRRKIRCIPSAYFEGKCENCTRTGKECRFLKVSEEVPGTTVEVQPNTTHRPLRAKSLCEVERKEYISFVPGQLDAKYHEENDMSTYAIGAPHRGTFAKHLQPSNDGIKPVSQLQMQPYTHPTDVPNWMASESAFMQPPPAFPKTEGSHQPWPPRPTLHHRSSEPYRLYGKTELVGQHHHIHNHTHHSSYGARGAFPSASPQAEHLHLDAQPRQSYFEDHFTGQWPLYDSLYHHAGSTDPSGSSGPGGGGESMTSERSSSLDALQPLDIYSSSNPGAGLARSEPFTSTPIGASTPAAAVAAPSSVTGSTAISLQPDGIMPHQAIGFTPWPPSSELDDIQTGFYR